MTYEQIKARIRQASKLIDAGDMAGADKIIRETPGLTRADLDAQMAPSDMEKMRKWARSSKRKTTKKTTRRKNAKKTSRRRTVEKGHPDYYPYHLRDLILDEDLALKAMDWHGGQDSMVYSLASTAYGGKLVSQSMIDAAIEELEADMKGTRGRAASAERRELRELIGELDSIARFPDEFTYEGEDDGYATWLMEREGNRAHRASSTKPVRKLKNRLMR